MKTKILTAIKLTVLALLLFSCKDEQVPTETIDPKLQRVIGDYKATKFKLPDPTDNTVDIIAKGGSISTKITKSATIEGRVIIPPGAFSSSYPGDDYYFSGKVVFIGNDSIKFNNTNNSLQIAPFRIIGDSLKLEVFSIGYIGITLRKITGG